MKDFIPIILWAILLGGAAFAYWGGRRNKKKYKDKDMTVTKDWYQNSQMKYSGSADKKAYYFHFDKNYLTQGHLAEDKNRQTVYEAKILYGDAFNGYEADFTNHLIGYTHHHKISAVTGTEFENGNVGVVVESTFRFDGNDIWHYIQSLGYRYHLTRQGLAYRIDIEKDGQVGTIYSSNNGKNFFESEGQIVAKMGGAGLYVIECADRDLDAVFLLAMAFARTEFSMKNTQ